MRHVAFIAKNRTNPAYEGALFGARAVAAKHGYEISHSAPHKPDDIEEQGSLIARAIAERPAAILLIPAHETKLTGAIRAINQAGIPLVTLAGEALEGEWVCHVGADDVRLTCDVALKVLPRLAPGARVAIMDGHPDSITTPKRHRGFLDAIERFPEARLVESVTGYYQSAPAREAALGLLARHPKLDALLAANDLMAMGVLQALDETGRDLLMVSVNGTPDAVAAIKQERLLASAAFDTLSFGCLGMEAAARHLRGEAVPRRIELPTDIIDETNWTAWDRPYEARARPDWDSTVRASRPRS
ncbi:MAG: sugar ABC transporter substrate-binding protein [Betaproteobacteria bacterium]|nr:sugar ABC transporter substrate-binding protein [Betaproteobacteria bacterium]